MNKIDLTYSGEIKGLLNIIQNKTFDIRYTVDGKTKKVTTISILINPKTMEMITFNYQDLKKLVGDSNE